MKRKKQNKRSIKYGGKTMNDSGKREEFKSGATREPATGKGRYDLISPEGLRRIAIWYEKGSEKYAPRNWEKGLPWSRCFSSMIRHAFAWMAGQTDEDHLAAVAWNAIALMHFEKFYSEGDDTGRPMYNIKRVFL